MAQHTVLAYIVQELRCVSLSGGIGSGTRLVTVQVHLGDSAESDNLHRYRARIRACMILFCYSFFPRKPKKVCR